MANSKYKPGIFIFFLLFFSGFSQAQEILPFQAEVNSIVDKYKQESWQKGGVLFTGSSSIRMWRELDNSFPHIPIINTGFGGSKTHELVLHLNELVLDFKPSKVFIYEGDNDVSAGLSTHEIILSFEKLTALIFSRLPDSQIFLICAKPSPSRWHLKAQYLDFNHALKTFAASDARLNYIDVWNPMLDKKGDPKPELFIQDNLHMNEKGYSIWKKAIQPFLN